MNVLAKIGAVPYTMSCLHDSNVFHQIRDAQDGMNIVRMHIQDLNDYTATKLNLYGDNGEMPKGKIQVVQKKNRHSTKY